MFLFLLSLITSALNGFVFMQVWNTAVAPLGAIIIGYWHATALIIVIKWSVAQYQHTPKDYRTDKEKGTYIFSRIVLSLIVWGLVSAYMYFAK